MPAFHGEDDGLRLLLRVGVVAEEYLAVHAAVRAFLLLLGPRADKAQRKTVLFPLPLGRMFFR